MRRILGTAVVKESELLAWTTVVRGDFEQADGTEQNPALADESTALRDFLEKQSKQLDHVVITAKRFKDSIARLDHRAMAELPRFQGSHILSMASVVCEAG